MLQILQDNDIELCFIAETWLKAQNTPITALIKDAGFTITHFNRSNRQGGGVAIISKQNHVSKYEKVLKFNTFECIIESFKIQHCQFNLTIVLIYRPAHHDENISPFLEEFYTLAEYVQRNFNCFIICGDFNLHYNKVDDPSIVKFNNILDTFSLCPAITGPTHNKGNTLDLILYDKDCNNVSNVLVDKTDTDCDHYMIGFDICVELKSVDKKEISYRNFKDIDLNHFQSDLLDATDTFLNNADCNDFHSSLSTFQNIFTDTVTKHAPLMTKTVTASNRPPWMDKEFLDARKERRKLYKKWKTSRSNETPEVIRLNRVAFEQQRSSVERLSKDKRSSYIQSSITQSSNCQKELSKITNNLLDSDKQSVLPYTENPEQLANNFNNFFVEKIETIRNNIVPPINSVVHEKPEINTNSHFSTFKHVSESELSKQIRSTKIKTCQRDSIPARLLKSSIEYILPCLAILVNISLSLGSMDGLKESVVTPILKKTGLDADVLSNYRPVCGGMYIDKLIQRMASLQLYEHMSRNGLHIAQQSGYKVFHSCETVLLKIVNDVLIVLDKGSCCILLLLDLSAAFDTVDHEELLYILEHEIGLKGTVLQWFKSFLSNRVQCTSVYGSKSSNRRMSYGVPQGSVLGPILFNIYVRNFIGMLEEAGFIVHGYADDHQVMYKFRIEFQYEALCYALPKALRLISQWMDSHFLKLNAGKSQLLVFTPNNVRDKLVLGSVYIGGNQFIPISFDAMNLGALLDSQLCFSPHITLLTSQSYRSISNFWKIRSFMTVDNLKTVVQSLIVSKLDSCNSLLYGVSEYEISRLQLLQNACARLIFGKKKFESVSHLLRELHWLPIKERICFKILLLVFKFFKNQTPIYISQCLHVSDLSTRTLKINRTNTPYGDRAFENGAPKMWNALPTSIKCMDTIVSFKKHLKHHLFSNFREFQQRVDRYLT